jgi:hypothetical protein
MTTGKTLSWLVALTGLWEVVAPFILGYSMTTVAMWNAIIIGAALIILAIWAAVSNQANVDRNLDWLNAVLGVWLILAPFALGYSAVMLAMWNDIIVGVVTIVLAAWAAIMFGRTAVPQI